MKEQYAYTKKKHCAQNNDARDNKHAVNAPIEN